MKCRRIFLLVVCILTRPAGSSKCCTIRKNIRRYFTSKHLIRYMNKPLRPVWVNAIEMVFTAPADQRTIKTTPGPTWEISHLISSQATFWCFIFPTSSRQFLISYYNVKASDSQSDSSLLLKATIFLQQLFYWEFLALPFFVRQSAIR